MTRRIDDIGLFACGACEATTEIKCDWSKKLHKGTDETIR